MNSISNILVTGAAGIVGTALRPILRESYQSILLSDIVELNNLAENESFHSCDLTDLETLTSLTKQADGVVHLGGLVGANYTFEETLTANIMGTHCVFEAAKLAGIKRVINASSHHAVGFTPRGRTIDHATPPRPNSEYALTKAYGEAAASYYADNFGLEILSIRIGYVGDDVSTERRMFTWISPRDLAQLIEIGFTWKDLHHEIVYGVSESPEPAFFDNSNAIAMGYQPLDRAADHVTDSSLLQYQPKLDSIEEGVVGAGFASAGFEGNVAKVLDH